MRSPQLDGARCVGVEALVAARSGEVFIVTLTADHRAVVAAEAQRRTVERGSLAAAGVLKIAADAGIGSNAARNGELPIARLTERLHRARHERIAHCL